MVLSLMYDDGWSAYRKSAKSSDIILDTGD